MNITKRQRVRKSADINLDMFKNIIYAVIDPVTQYPFYIGQSSDGIGRPLTHVTENSHNADVNDYIKILEEQGQQHIIVILEYVIQESMLDSKEIFWVNRYAQQGYPLLNKIKFKKNALNEKEEFHIDTQLKVLGQIIRVNRVLRKLTQKQLSETAGIGRSSISKIEQGNCNAEVGTLIKILNIFSLKLSVE